MNGISIIFFSKTTASTTATTVYGVNIKKPEAKAPGKKKYKVLQSPLNAPFGMHGRLISNPSGILP